MSESTHSQEFNLVNDLINSRLEAAVRAVMYSPNEKNRNGFLRELLSSYVIVFSNDISASNEEKQSVCLTDDEGFSYYRKDTIIPLVQLSDELGNLILPAFTSSLLMQQNPLAKAFKAINTMSISVFEMALASGSEKILLNPETELSIEIDKSLIQGIIQCLGDGEILDGNGFELQSITI